MAQDTRKEPTTPAAPSAPVHTGQGGQPITVDQLLGVVRELVAGQRLDADMVRDVAAKATTDAYDKLHGTGWDIRNYPGMSTFNPAGDKAQPRGEIQGEVFWVGTLMQRDELTPTEIDLINQLEPGVFHGGQWIVRDLQPGVRSKAHRKLLVLFPCTSQDARMSLPSMVDMLREMTAQTASPAVA